MIFHNRYLAITDIREMGQYTFDNLKGYEDFAKKAHPGDIVFAGKNFGSGSSRQQAVDCFISLGIQAIVAESFGAIYERNAINAAFPVITCKNIGDLGISDGDRVQYQFDNTEKLKIRQIIKMSQLIHFPKSSLKYIRKGGFSDESGIPFCQNHISAK